MGVETAFLVAFGLPMDWPSGILVYSETPTMLGQKQILHHECGASLWSRVLLSKSWSICLKLIGIRGSQRRSAAHSCTKEPQGSYDRPGLCHQG